MGADILSIGSSGLAAAQRQLTTTSHNISNVNTEGYSRQRAELEASIPAKFTGSGYIGTGVNVQTTVRLANEFLEEQVRDANSRYGQYDSFYQLSAQIDNILANPNTGLTPTLEGFYSALQEVNDDPSSTPARQVFLTEANVLTDRFQLIDDHFTDLNQAVNDELVNLTSEIASIASSIASLNVDIIERIGAGQGNMPNDLMDQREALIKLLSEKIDVNVVYQDDGAANIFVGAGQALVLAEIASGVTTDVNKYDPQKLDIILTQGSGRENITRSVTGGELEGLLSFRETVLEPSINSLGRIAIALSEEMNTQHRLGMTIQGSEEPFPLGGDFFTVLNGDQTLSPTPFPIKGLPGQVSASTASLTITDSQVLTTSNYQLAYDGSNYSLTRLNDGKVFSDPLLSALSATVSASEGFSISSTIASGESFLLKPTASASSLIGVKVNNVLDIAIASPIISGEVTDNVTGGALNSGTGSISLPVINSLENIPITGSTIDAFDITLTYASPNDVGVNPGFNISSSIAALNGLSIDYDPSNDFSGKTFAFDGVTLDSNGVALPIFGDISFTLSGIPDDFIPDSFVISRNDAPYDDNRNGLLMSALQTAKTIENGSSSFQAAYGILVSDVGNKTYAAEIDSKAQLTMLETVKANRESYSGVNLDEEAALLLRYQQAYQANSKVIASANQMFQDLLNAIL